MTILDHKTAALLAANTALAAMYGDSTKRRTAFHTKRPASTKEYVARAVFCAEKEAAARKRKDEFREARDKRWREQQERERRMIQTMLGLRLPEAQETSRE